MKQHSLRNMVGQEIAVRIPCLKEDVHMNVILEAVDEAGIWINSKEINKQIFAESSIKASLKSIVVFVPFAKIDFVIGVSELAYLSEESLGV